jgi:lipopolysaccharide transport system ATP-binding protein
MSDVAIAVENVSKSYLIGHRTGQRERYTALRDVIAREARNFARKGVDFIRGREIVQGDDVEQFWALRDVSFEVKRGEVLGIIGRNGAGKSTLLKILSRITEPDRGRAVLRGRVASLLEVGTGFHPELTGRENIFLNGAILGMTRAEISKKFDEIVAFAEVERFLDTPVKRYSSGMYVRLAFSVAAHLEPDILIVDEVLAVGDAQFQKKCLGKMNETAHDRGRTVLLVTHNVVAVQSLCKHCIVLNSGHLTYNGNVEGGVTAYFGQISEGLAERAWNEPESSPGNEFVRISRVALVPDDVSDAGQLTMASGFRIEVDYEIYKPQALLHVMFHLFNERGILVLSTAARPVTHQVATYRSICEFPGGLLNEGGYSLKLQVVQDNSVHLYVHENIASFQIIDSASRLEGWMGREPGVIQPKFLWHTQMIRETVKWPTGYSGSPFEIAEQNSN